MAILNLSGQDIEKEAIVPKIDKLKSLIEQRREVWNKLSNTKKEKWIKSELDPIMTVAWPLHQYLKKYFFELNADDKDLTSIQVSKK